MTDTPNLQLPFIASGQAMKHITHNEALQKLDSIVQLGVVSRVTGTPPASPAEGERYIVPAGATGVWAAQEGNVAAFQNGAWQYLVPQAGWLTWVADEAALLVFDGEWQPASVVSGAPLFGINTDASASNRLAVKSDAVLFSHDDVTPGSGDQRTVLNKESETDTASLVFQTGYSGRAEFGMPGNDDFRIKVSPDGSTWHEAMVVDKTNGQVRFPSGGTREILSAGRTYFVDGALGSDANDGLAGGAGAFATLQKAADVVFGTLDLGGHGVTISVADGTYTAGVSQAAPQVGAGTIKFQGNTTTPANCIVSVTGGYCFNAVGGATQFLIDGFELRTSGSGNCVNTAEFASITILPNMRFGPCATRHVSATRGANVTISSGYEIVGGAVAHFYATQNGVIFSNGDTFNLSGTPAFSNFCDVTQGSAVRITSATFVGSSATGNRFAVSTNGVLYTGGGGASYFPGDSTGTSVLGGVYI